MQILEKKQGLMSTIHQIVNVLITHVLFIWRWLSDKDLGNYSTSHGVRTLCILVEVISGDFCCCSQIALHGTHSPWNHRCGVMRLKYAMPVCVLFVFNILGIIFNPRVGAISEHSQSAKNIDLYFKSQFYVKALATESQYPFYWMGWVNPARKRIT